MKERLDCGFSDFGYQLSHHFFIDRQFRFLGFHIPVGAQASSGSSSYRQPGKSGSSPVVPKVSLSRAPKQPQIILRGESGCSIRSGPGTGSNIAQVLGPFARQPHAGFGPGSLGARGITRPETHVCPGLLQGLEPRGSGPVGRPLVPASGSRGGPGEIGVPGQRASCRNRAGRQLWGSNLSAGQGGAARSTGDAKRRCRAGLHRHADVAAAPRKRGRWGARLQLAGDRLLGRQQRIRRPRPASGTLRPAGSVVLSPASHRRGLGCAGGHRSMHIPPTG